jgi:hypothetical protein
MTRSRRRGPLTAAVILLTFATVACTGGPGATGAASGGPATSPSGGPASPSPSSRQVPIPSPSGSPEAGAVPDEVVQAAIADAALQTGMDPAAITVVSAQPKIWNDGSLGCPEPGQMYTQALVPGYQIVLDAGGKQLDYHASGNGAMKLCENGPKLGG